MRHDKYGKPAVSKILWLTGIGKHVRLNDVAMGLMYSVTLQSQCQLVVIIKHAISQALGLFTYTDGKACLMSMHVACFAFPSNSAFSLAHILLTMQYDRRKHTLVRLPSCHS